MPPLDPPSELASVADAAQAIAGSMEEVIRGKPDLIRGVVTCLLAGGHVLIEDVPGVGKTMLGKALARSIGGRFGRVQFTPDLLPSDVVGTTVWNQHDGTFAFRPGPVFANVVLADEINRASPKTQAALLESMAEHQVTADGRTHRLPDPHIVIATQNPLEHHGTYPLPESQLDRFLMRMEIGYPPRSEELRLLVGSDREDVLRSMEPVIDLNALRHAAQVARSVNLSPPIASYIVDLADATRGHPDLLLGMSPRTAIGLQRVARVAAAWAGRAFVIPDDVQRWVVAVVAHRLILDPEAVSRGVTREDVVEDVLRSTAVPRGTRVPVS